MGKSKQKQKAYPEKESCYLCKWFNIASCEEPDFGFWLGKSYDFPKKEYGCTSRSDRKEYPKYN